MKERKPKRKMIREKAAERREGKRGKKESL